MLLKLFTTFIVVTAILASPKDRVLPGVIVPVFIEFTDFYLLIYCVILNYILVQDHQNKHCVLLCPAIPPQFTGCSIYIPITSLQFIQTNNGVTNNDILF